MRLLVLLVLVGCSSTERSHAPDAGSIDSALTSIDGASCSTADAGVAQACLSLAPTVLRGSTPFGVVDGALTYFGSGDCLTITHATIGWRSACGDELSLSFSYPVRADSNNKRHVDPGSYDAAATFAVEPPGGGYHYDTTMVHVDVVTWQEGDGLHTVDITVGVTDSRYGLAPVHIQGTFCDWPYYLC
jgi:hypothetical protein